MLTFALLLSVLPADAAVPGTGDLVFTEIMGAPSCQYNEWVEVHNPTAEPMDLGGCVLSLLNPTSGSAAEHTIAGNPSVDPGAFAVLYRSSGSCGDVTCVDGDCAVPVLYEYGSLQFSNTDQRDVSLRCDGVEVDQVAVDLDAFRCNDGVFGSCTIQLDPANLTALSLIHI